MKKRDLIKEFQKELNSLDHNYVYSLHSFKSDTVKIVKLMREQFSTLRNKMLVLIWNKDYYSDASNDIKNKLNNSPDEKKNCIEGEFLRDRSRMLAEYNKNIKDLMKKLETAEKEFAQFLTRNEDEKELKNEKEAFKEESKFINKIIVMEKFFNILKENIEDFTYELKILLEKLEYRVEVREEKIIENNENKEQYTKRRNRMKERNSKAMEMYKNVDDAKRSENIALKLDFIRTTESFDDLKKKFRHFEIYDEEQFIKIYKMNFAESRNIAIKLLLADRTIRSQQLGIDVFDINQEGFTLDDLQNMQVDSEESSLSKKSKNDGTKNKNDSNFKAHILSKIPFDRVKEVFSLIIQEAEFLVDLDIKEKYGHLPIDEKINYYSECICKALQIKTESELNQLLDIFDKKSAHSKLKEVNENDNSQNLDESNKDDQEDEKTSNKLQIDPDKVLDYLKEFYEEKKKNSKNEVLGKAGSTMFNEEDNQEVYKERMIYLSETVWKKKFGLIITDKTHNIWKALFNGLTNYNDLLFERRKIVVETADLYDKNKELKKLLKVYLDKEDNHLLKVPPYQTIKVEKIKIALSDLVSNPLS